MSALPARSSRSSTRGVASTKPGSVVASNERETRRAGLSEHAREMVAALLFKTEKVVRPSPTRRRLGARLLLHRAVHGACAGGDRLQLVHGDGLPAVGFRAPRFDDDHGAADGLLFAPVLGGRRRQGKLRARPLPFGPPSAQPAQILDDPARRNGLHGSCPPSPAALQTACRVVTSGPGSISAGAPGRWPRRFARVNLANRALRGGE